MRQLVQSIKDSDSSFNEHVPKYYILVVNPLMNGLVNSPDEALYAGKRITAIRQDKHTVSPTTQFTRGTTGEAAFLQSIKHCIFAM